MSNQTEEKVKKKKSDFKEQNGLWNNMNSYCFIQCSYLFIPEKINKSFIVLCIALNND
jgi:hypothetical protein